MCDLSQLVRLRASRATADSLRLACQPKLAQRAKAGADDRDRTGDLVLTKDALCQLSYIGLRPSGYGRQVGHPNPTRSPGLPSEAASAASASRRMERETGIEPATNSLEGCDSTTELLPPSRLALFTLFGASARKPDARPSALRRASPTRASLWVRVLGASLTTIDAFGQAGPPVCAEKLWLASRSSRREKLACQP